MALKEPDIERRKVLARKLLNLAYDLLSTDELMPGQKVWTCGELAELCGFADFNPQMKTRPPVARNL